jgi:glycosyltransferase involved in cell wall biosynthesis
MPPAEFKPGLKVFRAWSIRPERHNFEAVRVENILISLSFSLSCAFLLLWKREEYDIVHFHGASLPLFVNLPLLKLLRKKVVAKVAAAKVGTEAGSLRGRYAGLGNLLAHVLSQVDAFVATTGEIEEGLRHDGISPCRIERISNFIDFSTLFSTTERERVLAKERKGATAPRQVAFSGRFVERKGIAFLLKAWVTLIREFPEARLILFGDGPLLPTMKAMAVELGINSSVEFPGHINQVTDALLTADIFVLPSLQEGMPNSLLEAMACGLPPVATRIGGVEDIVTDGENGVLVEPGDAASLATGLRRLLADKDLSLAIAARAGQSIHDLYSIDSVLPKYLALYQRLLAEKPGREE